MKKWIAFLLFLAVAGGVIGGLHHQGMIQIPGLPKELPVDWLSRTEKKYEPAQNSDSATSGLTGSPTDRTPAGSPATAVDAQEAQKRYARMVQLYEKGQWQKALQECQAARQQKIPLALEQDVEAFYQTLRNLERLVGEIVRKPALPDQIDVVELHNGSMLEGKILARGSDGVTILLQWDRTTPMKTTLAHSQIKRLGQTSGKEFQQRILKDAEKQLEQLSLNDAGKVVHFLEHCARHNLDSLLPKVIQSLEKSKPRFVEELLAYQARRLYQSYSWCMLMGESQRAKQYQQRLLEDYADSEVAREVRDQGSLSPLAFKEPRRGEPTQPEVKPQPERRPPAEVTPSPKIEPQPKPKVEQGIRSTNKKAAQWIEQGDQFYRTGYEHLKRSFPGEPNAERELASAKKDFEEAVRLYEKALEADPQNKPLEAHLQKVMEYYAHCHKHTRLGKK